MGEVTLSELLDFKPRLWTSQADKWEKNAKELATQATDIHAAARKHPQRCEIRPHTS